MVAVPGGEGRTGSHRLTVFVGQTYTDSCNWEAVVRGDPASHCHTTALDIVRNMYGGTPV